MKLVIAEKPSVARDIAAVIGADENINGVLRGNGYIVTSARGHLAVSYTHLRAHETGT